MVSPPATQLEVARRETFSTKTKSLHQGDRLCVVRLDVGLEPVQPLLPEGTLEDQRHSLAHEASARVRLECVVTEVRGVKRSVDDLVEIDDSDESSRTRVEHKVTLVGRLLRAAQKDSKGLRSEWRVREVAMETSTSSRGLEKPGLVPQRRRAQNDPRRHAFLLSWLPNGSRLSGGRPRSTAKPSNRIWLEMQSRSISSESMTMT